MVWRQDLNHRQRYGIIAEYKKRQDEKHPRFSYNPGLYNEKVAKVIILPNLPARYVLLQNMRHLLSAESIAAFINVNASIAASLAGSPL